MAQSVKHPILDLGSGHDLAFHGIEPASTSALTVQSLLRILSLSLPLLNLHTPLKINKYLKKNLQLSYPNLSFNLSKPVAAVETASNSVQNVHTP